MTALQDVPPPGTPTTSQWTGRKDMSRDADDEKKKNTHRCFRARQEDGITFRTECRGGQHTAGRENG